MDENAPDEATRLELEIETEDQEQSRAITRQIGLEIDSSQNRAGRKAKGSVTAEKSVAAYHKTAGTNT